MCAFQTFSEKSNINQHEVYVGPGWFMLVLFWIDIFSSKT